MADLAAIGLGGVIGGWAGAIFGKRLSARVVRYGTILVSLLRTVIFFLRAYR